MKRRDAVRVLTVPRWPQRSDGPESVREHRPAQGALARGTPYEPKQFTPTSDTVACSWT